jgi:tripartite-type tricarboxylate transporter receptor subunit TctC
MVKTRQPALPHVPTVAEFVPGYEANFWTGIAAPKGTPAEIVDKVNKAVNAGFADPDVKARLDEWGATALSGSPADFAKFVADETEKNRARSSAPPTSRRSKAPPIRPTFHKLR